MNQDKKNNKDGLTRERDELKIVASSSVELKPILHLGNSSAA